MKLFRPLAVILVSSALFLAPVTTPVWATPRPVAPSVHRLPIAGVNDAALAAAPPALDPDTISTELLSPDTTATKRRASPSRRPAVMTAQLDTGRFTAAGLTWDAGTTPADAVVQVRIRERGVWSDWQHLDITAAVDSGDSTAKPTGHVSTEPISTASADAIQVRVDGRTPLNNLTIVAIDPGTSAADANLGAPATAAHGAVTKPTIITRAQWGADESLRNCQATYSPTIKVGFVHHTVSTNDYAPSDSASMIRGIYAYHVNGNGWCDIGYNFIVDRYGQMFEGRGGGMDRPVIGAHTLAFNYNSFSVSALGTFSSVEAPPAMTSSMARSWDGSWPCTGGTRTAARLSCPLVAPEPNGQPAPPCRSPPSPGTGMPTAPSARATSSTPSCRRFEPWRPPTSARTTSEGPFRRR